MKKYLQYIDLSQKSNNSYSISHSYYYSIRDVDLYKQCLFEMLIENIFLFAFQSTIFSGILKVYNSIDIRDTYDG